MLLEKNRILEALRERGLEDRAAFVDKELPDQVDTKKHGGLLSMLGLNPAELTDEPSTEAQ
jgi:hypothetical protein